MLGFYHRGIQAWYTCLGSFPKLIFVINIITFWSVYIYTVKVSRSVVNVKQHRLLSFVSCLIQCTKLYHELSTSTAGFRAIETHISAISMTIQSSGVACIKAYQARITNINRTGSHDFDQIVSNPIFRSWDAITNCWCTSNLSKQSPAIQRNAEDSFSIERLRKLLHLKMQCALGLYTRYTTRLKGHRDVEWMLHLLACRIAYYIAQCITTQKLSSPGKIPNEQS
jgi:hypothetical protein